MKQKERKIIIDSRETHLKQFILNKLDFESKNLILGDIVFLEGDNIEFLIERKTLQDLYSSVIDGRYSEQKKRLMDEISDTNRILYLFEGNLNYVTSNKKKQKCVYGGILNTFYRDKIPIYRTNNLEETGNFILELAHRFLENKSPFPIKNKESNKPLITKLKKKNDITSENCFFYQLQQIPKISDIKAQLISEKWNNMSNFVLEISAVENPVEIIENLKLKSGKKFGKKNAESLLFFLGINKKNN